MNLFDEKLESIASTQAPLATRMRPSGLDEFVGQEHILGPGTVLRRSIETDQLGSLILYGPPGSGKTSLARIIARMTSSYFEQLSAVTSGVADVRDAIRAASDRLAMEGRRTMLFIDEIHRFNKSQQDALLPAVEDRIIVLLGATTENPYFEVNSPLVSRSRIFELKALTGEEVAALIDRALSDSERGLGRMSVVLEPDARSHIVDVADGDARSALNALEMAALTTSPETGGTRRVTLDRAADAVQRRALVYEKAGDSHYDTVSAFIKSMRGSDPDAALYWLARMIYAGEDPRFIARRMVIFASEDVGNADPQSLLVASAAAQAVELVGLPECRINLAQAVAYLAAAPKSNSAIVAIDAALADVRRLAAEPVPDHLKDGHYPGAEKLGRGNGYKYPHAFPGNWVPQEHLPPGLRGRRYYEPTKNGFESEMSRRLREIRANSEGAS
ncbi:MAG: replication-associated recombination protein A [Actinobacteria bacterium]|nr:MAG: replication-associated recombination protein A [Actinomycetota bacterium]